MSNVLDDFLFEGSKTSFKFGTENTGVTVKEFSITDQSTKVVFSKPNPGEVDSEIIWFINWPSPKQGATGITPEAFKMFVNQVVNFGEQFLPRPQVSERANAAAAKELNGGSVSDALGNLESSAKLCKAILEGVFALLRQDEVLYKTQGTLVLGYNQKAFLTPPKYGQSGVFHVPFYTNGTPVLPSADNWFLHVRPVQNQNTTATVPPPAEADPW